MFAFFLVEDIAGGFKVAQVGCDIEVAEMAAATGAL